MATILVADDKKDIRELVEMTLRNRGHEVVAVDSGTAALQAVERVVPDLAILDVNMPGMEGTHVARALRARPATATIPIILLTALSGEADTLAGFAAGADGYITKPFNPRELAARVAALLARAGAGSAPMARPQGRLIPVIGPKGGVGRTTVAVNLAVLTQLRGGGQRTIVIDGSLALGDVGVHLNLSADRSVVDLIPYADRVDVNSVESTLSKHRSGVEALLAPGRPEEAERITPSLWREVISTAAAVADMVFVDTDPFYGDERTILTLEQASDILLVVTPEIGAVRNARAFMDLAPQLGVDTSRVRVVVNRLNARVGLSAKDIFEILPTEQIAQLPDGGPVVSAQVNVGKPIVEAEPRSDLSKRLQQLASALVGAPVVR